MHAYERVKRELLDEIHAGAYRLDQPFVTEREICDRFGVSRATAVRALSDLVHTGVLMRQRGRGTFVVPPVASPTRRSTDSQAHLIGCIFHHLHGQHPVEILRGIQRVCRNANYHLLLFDSEGSAHVEALNVERARAVGVQGLIIYPTDGFANVAAFESLAGDNLPFVLIDRYYPTLPTNAVVPDNLDLGFRLTDYLIQQGHTQIAVLWEEVQCTSVHDRLAGYKQALSHHGLPIDPDLSALRPYPTLPIEQRRARLSQWLERPVPPTAYIAVNNEVLVTVATDLLALGLRIPEDVVIASMDNAGHDPLLTLAEVTATLPSYQIGERAMRLLADQLSGGAAQRQSHLLLPITLATNPAILVSLRSADAV